MKTIITYISEKLRLNTAKTYTCQPQTKKELRNILEERLAENKNANLNDIDVSEITDMGFMKDDGHGVGLFENLDPHNIDISEWDVSNVENMTGMFQFCKNFNSDLSAWDVSKVENMYAMFFECENFEGKGLENWNTSKAQNFNHMFIGCKKLNCNIDNWNTNNVRFKSNIFLGSGLAKNPPKWYNG